MHITVVVGNPKPASRTLSLAVSLAEAIASDGDTVTPVDLAEHASRIFDWPSAPMAELSEQVASSDLVVVGSPTYKATYTGLLKGFLDRYPHLGLKDVCAVPLMTGADKGHSMAPDTGLRPLLVELGALVPTRSFYLETPMIDRTDELVAAWCEENAAGLRQIRLLAEAKVGA